MSEKRYYCDSTNENRDYMIFDLSKSPKTKEDFWNEEEECYELWRFQIYLMDETDAMMNSKEVEELLNKQDQKIKELENKITKIEEIIDNRLDKNVRPKWQDNNELFIEEKVGYYYALEQLKKKLIREKICFNDINIEDME